MAEFNRFDICEAHLLIEAHYNVGGWVRERPSNQRRAESTGVQLHRIGFKPGISFGWFKNLTDNGQEIYRDLQRRYGFPVIHLDTLVVGGSLDKALCEDFYIEGDEIDTDINAVSCEDCLFKHAELAEEDEED